MDEEEGSEESEEEEEAVEEMEDATTMSEAGNTEDYDAKHVNFR